ncbi:MAG TPA: heparan-alpha-glucosaminide N-acetyltransferase [Methanocorpusculum sp.]|nr:heparan-alpha-glucosaminide N-acetyltransferase [Methanocorpusculum sp.]
MGRYYEVDAVRGIALLCMIVYHTLFCLYFFTDFVPWFNPAVQSGAPIAACFIGIAGLSLVLAKAKTKKYLIRGLELIGLGLCISLVTWFFYPSGFVVFGVLSLIGIGTILSIPFVSQRVKWFVPAGVGIILVLLNLIVSKVYLSIPYLIPLGFKVYGFSSIDYEPLIPWFGVMLIGLALGKLLYPGGARRLFLEKLGGMPRVLKPLCFAGRHTLIIYLVHVPVIILVMMLFGVIDIGMFFS